MLYLYSERNDSSSFLPSTMIPQPTPPLTAPPLTVPRRGPGETRGRGGMRGGTQPPGGGGGGSPAPGTQTPGPDSGAKTGDKRSARSPAPGESDSPKKSRGDVDVPPKKALTLQRPRSYHMNKKEIEKEEKPTKARAVFFVFFKISFLFHRLSLPSKRIFVRCGCYHPRMTYRRSSPLRRPRSSNNASPLPVRSQPPCAMS